MSHFSDFFLAHMCVCTVASGLLYIAFCLSVRKKNSLGKKNDILKSIVPRVMKLGRGIDLVDLLIGHRSKVEVTR